MEARQRKNIPADAGAEPHPHLSAAEIVEKVEDVAHEVADKVSKKLTCMWHELEDWQRDNHFIVSGYRPATRSYLLSLRSLFYWHNESVNIYTHLLGALFFGTLSKLLYDTLSPRYSSATRDDVYMFSIFFVGCLTCLGMSAWYHTVSNHSHEAARMWNVMDYVGIVGLIAGSCIPSLYYGFLCENELRWAYWGMITAIGIGCATVSIAPKFRTPAYRPFRTSMFIAMGLSAVFPILHGWYLFGFTEINRKIGLSWMIAEGVAYIGGAVLYACRVPERWMPGTFDYLGASHQIFHVMVLVGAGCHLKGMVESFDYAHGVGGGTCL